MQNLNNFSCFRKGEYLPTMISAKNAVREPTAEKKVAKSFPKIAESC